MRVGMGALAIPPGQFWKLTFPEFWAIHDGRFGKQEKNQEPPLTMDLVREWTRKREQREQERKRNGGVNRTIRTGSEARS